VCDEHTPSGRAGILDHAPQLGFKLRDAGKLLLAFVKFMEQCRASYITTKLALAWAQLPSTVQPAEWAPA